MNWSDYFVLSVLGAVVFTMGWCMFLLVWRSK
jgi:hypothetical protein